MDCAAVDFASMSPDDLAVFGTDAAIQESSEKNELSEKYSNDEGVLQYVGDKVRTVEELLAYANIDQSVWEVAEATINRWEVGGKKRNGQGQDGKWLAETLWKTPLLQIKVKLRRKVPKHIHDGILEVLSQVPAWRGSLPPVPVRDVRTDSHLLELSLFDAHLGKLCWHPETGTDYDLDIAVGDLLGGVEDLLTKVSGFHIDRITIPIGNDFFQADNWLSTTHRGTRVDSTDDRFPKVYRQGYDAIEQIIMRCREIADVEVLWIPGNHDKTTSWYLSEQLRAVHADDPHVRVDNSPRKRKYRLYGITLIGYDHGDSMPIKDLPGMFMAEASELLAKSVYRTWRIGHFHASKRMKWWDNETIAGVDVTVLPSLSGTDAWHFENGYVGNMRAAVASLWNRETGPTGTFTVEARSAVESRKTRPSDPVELGQIL